ncbi:glucose dehydrogenase [Sulfitobacter sp. SK012]|uniref:PQQ-dependent sugar dehydrogenase n=1 Tax=Sulfitobacter sp. SK012 TaxID=1389005 RepID=UPI000E0B06C8|nr:PQQ-dependent sugar dehydrogenase [Sulfitobacter sp. SK012]AXI47458.1 glucose dehydrogenase [Sulfitobacter sp. SK012]
MHRFMSLLALMLAAPVALAQPVEQGPKNVPGFDPEWPTQTRAPETLSGVEMQVEVLASGLSHPWGMAVLPDGSYLVTERDGRLRMILNGVVQPPIKGVPDVLAKGQGGLLDVALAPDFATSRMIFLTYAKPMSRGRNATAAARAVLSLDGTEITGLTDIFVQDPPSTKATHFGSRIVLDGIHAYITTGEHFTRSQRKYAQDVDKTYGKVVRVTLDGTAPSDNPFAAQGPVAATVWSLGHRNVQGAAIRPATGELWTLEHGPKGGDELNRIEKGANFGWPIVSYGENYNGRSVGSGIAVAEGMTAPRYYWDPVIAPGGFTFYQGEMFGDWQGDVLAASLNPGGLVRLILDGDTVVGEERFMSGDRRIRDVEIDHDGAILLLDDGEGAVLRLTPK